MIHATRTFRSGNSEAVRLPKGLGFGVGTAVMIERDGDRLILTPVHSEAEQRRRFLAMIEDMKAIVGDTPLPRQERDPDWWPDRPFL